MTLRTRLLAAALVVTCLLVVLLGAIAARQRTVLTDQIDVQLQNVAGAAIRSPLLAIGSATRSQRPGATSPTGDIYLAAVDSAGALQVVAEPATEPRFVPDVDRVVALAIPVDVAGPLSLDEQTALAPVTIRSTNDGSEARAIVLDLGAGLTLIVAHSTTRVEDAQRQLLLTSALAILAVVATLALALWWVDRLGLRPISRLTDAAEDVAGGRSDRRVEHPPLSTEAGRLGAAFNTMLDAREEAEARQRRFVADASHELRTPLTTLQGYAALHRSGGLDSPEAIDDAMSRIAAEAGRMAALVEDLLTLASLDEERPLDLSTLDLSQLLVDIGADVAAVQPDREVDLDGVSPGLELEADRHLLTQAITAVTSNVMRHTPPEAGLEVTAQAHPGGRCAITITDRGPGIEPRLVPNLFDRFYRVDASRAAPSGGRGLGLSIARTVVEAHGGRVTAESELGRGTTITIVLPTAVGDGHGGGD